MTWLNFLRAMRISGVVKIDVAVRVYFRGRDDPTTVTMTTVDLNDPTLGLEKEDRNVESSD
jgi:sugar phosphate permease